MTRVQVSRFAAISLLCLVAPLSGRANLIVNGDFEDPVVGAPPYAYLTGAQLTGWTVFSAPGHNGVVLFNTGYRAVGEGNQSLQIEYPGDYIFQDFATSIGQTYRVSFLFSTYDGSAGGVKVSAGPGSLTVTGPEVPYGTHFFDFTATGLTTTLTLESTAFYPHVDGVSVLAVPDAGPGVFGMLTLIAVMALPKVRQTTQRFLRS